VCQALLAELLPRVAPELLGGLPAWRALAQARLFGFGDGGDFFGSFMGTLRGSFMRFLGRFFDFEGISMGFSQGYVIFLHFKMFSFYVSDNCCNITKQMMIKKDECGE
jgi:hypothetical protein